MFFREAADPAFDIPPWTSKRPTSRPFFCMTIGSMLALLNQVAKPVFCISCREMFHCSLHVICGPNLGSLQLKEPDQLK